MRPGFHYQLRDGGTILLRPLAPADRGRLQRGLAWMSDASRYTRFLSPVVRFTDAELRYLCDVDQRTHVAWGALDPSAPQVPGAGVARYVLLADEPGVAEIAIAVVDPYQRRGVGEALLAALCHEALSAGVHSLRATVLPGRRGLIDRLRALGATLRHRDGLVEGELPLAAWPAGLTATPAGRRFATALEAVRRASGCSPARGRSA